MALIKCSDCGHEVSDRAQKCPKCGCPIQKKEIVKPPIQSQQIEQPKETKQVPHISDRQQSKKTNVWFPLVASLVVMAAIAAVYFGISKNNSKADTAEVNDDIEVELAEESTSPQTTNINILTDGEHSGDEAKLNLKKTDVSLDNASAGLTFRIFTEKAIENNVVYQNRLSAEEVSKKLMGLGFELIKSETKSRYNHIDEVYYDAAIDTYTKTVNGNTTTVIYDEVGSTKIIFPTFDDVKVFENTIKECGLQKGDGEYEDAKEIYWAGTDVYIDGKTVILHYKSES